ncbi:MAG: DUF2934 domain-containing protein [Synechococcus sp.]
MSADKRYPKDSSNIVHRYNDGGCKYWDPESEVLTQFKDKDGRTPFQRWVERTVRDNRYGGRKYWGPEAEVQKRLAEGAPPPNRYRPEDTHRLIAERAKFLWDIDGRQEGRDEYYWVTAERQLRSEVAPVTGPFVRVERILEAALRWFKSLAIFEIFEVVGSVGIAIAVISFIANQDIRHEQDVFTAW